VKEQIAGVDQGGLTLPDRDYYLKDDPKSEELRKAYVTHVAKMFELVGDKPADAAAEAAIVMRIETALAKGQMSRVERRDPPKLYHKMKVEELQKLAPAFGWNTYFAQTSVGSLAALNVAIHALAVVFVRRPVATGLVASAQLGVPAAIATLGLSEHVLSADVATAIVAAALVSVTSVQTGASARDQRGRLARAAPFNSPQSSSGSVAGLGSLVHCAVLAGGGIV